MESKIVEKGQMLLVGFSFFGDPFSLSGGWTEENEIGRLWNRFLAYLSPHKDSIKHLRTDEVMYEVHISHDETASTGNHEVFVGLEVERLEGLPVELSVKVLPATTYAVFTLHGEEITSDWTRTILNEWLPEMGVQLAFPYSFQHYDRRFKGLDNIEESTLDVYVPVK